MACNLKPGDKVVWNQNVGTDQNIQELLTKHISTYGNGPFTVIGINRTEEAICNFDHGDREEPALCEVGLCGHAIKEVNYVVRVQEFDSPFGSGWFNKV